MKQHTKSKHYEYKRPKAEDMIETRTKTTKNKQSEHAQAKAKELKIQKNKYSLRGGVGVCNSYLLYE